MTFPEHPEIAWAMRTGYPSWQQEDDEVDADEYYDDYDLYEQRRERERWD